MPDAGPAREPVREDDGLLHEVPPGSPRIMDDPVVRRMTHLAGLLAIAFLLVVLSALVTGTLNPSGPRTLAEKNLALAGTQVAEGSSSAAEWATFVSALVNDGQVARARMVMGDARASADDSATAELSLAEVRLLRAEGDNAKALSIADEAMLRIMAAHEQALAAGGPQARVANSRGVHENYFIAALLKAAIYAEQGEWQQAIESYDIYLGQYRGAADILVDRGLAKSKVDDLAGAEEDFRTALQFDPHNAEALEALQSIGVSP